MRGLLYILVAAALGSALLCPALVTASDQPDQLAIFTPLLGHWHGEGNSQYGSYLTQLDFRREGDWVLVDTELIDIGTGQQMEDYLQVFGLDQQGRLRDWCFDQAGEAEFAVTPGKDGLGLHWEAGQHSRDCVWQLSPGRIARSYTEHDASDSSYLLSWSEQDYKDAAAE